MTRRSALLQAFILAIAVLGASASFAQNVPTPEEVIGFKVGADFKLASYDQAYKYFQALERSSPMIKCFEIGKTEMGKPQLAAVITSAENMQKLDRWKEIAARLAQAKDLTDQEAHRLAAEGRAVVYIDGGLHSTEVAPAQHNMQLAYDLVTGNDTDTRLIRENVVLLLVFANPDGMNMVAEWYMPHVGTPFERSPMPWVYNKYVGHDNNRDSFMNNMTETRNITRLVFKDWNPQVLLNHHQTAPFPARIFVPPHTEPTNPNYHPSMIRWQTLFGAAMGARLDQEGKPGAISRIGFDSWFAGYVTHSVNARNVISLLTETAGYGYATPHNYTLEEIPPGWRDFRAGVFYPSPWKGGWWRLRDAVDYIVTSSKAVLHTAALYREKLLYERYRMGQDAIAKFQREAPYAWVIPQDQWDGPVAALLVDKLTLLGIDVYQATQPFTADGQSYPAGSWVVPTSQAFGRYVKNLLEEQRYPDMTDYPALWQGVPGPQQLRGAYFGPQDTCGWTLQYQLGVKAIRVDAPLDAPLVRVEKPVAPAGKIEGAGEAGYLLPARNNNSFIAVNRLLKAGGEVYRLRQAFEAAGRKYEAGTFLVLAKNVPGPTMEKLAKDLSVTATRTGKLAVAPARFRAPRIALYKSWTASMDEGWTRWLFERYEFPFTNIADAEVKAGGLAKKYDVVVIPSMNTSAIVDGLKQGAVPPEYTGGMTGAGVANIKTFVEEGGTLVLMNSSTLFAIDALGVPVEYALKGVRQYGSQRDDQAEPPEFVCPGSILRMRFDAAHPIAYGMPEEAPAYFIGSTPFNIPQGSGAGVKVVAQFPGGNLLMSGYLKGEQFLQNRPAIVEVPIGKGKIIMLGFAVQQRAQPHGTFRLLFNSLYYSSMEQAAVQPTN